MKLLSKSGPCLTRLIAVLAMLLCSQSALQAGPLKAGVAKIDIAHPDHPPAPNDGLWVKALVLTDDVTTVALVTIDAVAIDEIGSIRHPFLANVRAKLATEIKLDPLRLLVNASHCHGTVCGEIEQRTVDCVKQAAAKLTEVRVGVGTGQENRIMENRRLRLKNGREADVRHAYALRADEEIVGVGPIDPEIGLLRLDRLDGRPLAVVYNFACHPIQGVPAGTNTADLTGFASQVIEENLGSGAVALFVQGCGGDINPVYYKDVHHPRDAETLGNLLGLSTLKAVHRIETKPVTSLQMLHRKLSLPRADLAPRIEEAEARQQQLLRTLRGTSLNLKTFLGLAAKYNLSTEFPSYYSHRYLLDRHLGRTDLQKLDEENRRNIEAYLQNIFVMEELTRLATNLALLKKHHAQNVAAGSRTLEVEVTGLRVGDFVLVTFPGELTVQIGLNIKQKSPYPETFVAGYTNGYIYYSPTAEQLRNVGHAQEDSDCLLAPEWQEQFETAVKEILAALPAK